MIVSFTPFSSKYPSVSTSVFSFPATASMAVCRKRKLTSTEPLGGERNGGRNEMLGMIIMQSATIRDFFLLFISEHKIEVIIYDKCCTIKLWKHHEVCICQP